MLHPFCKSPLHDILFSDFVKFETGSSVTSRTSQVIWCSVPGAGAFIQPWPERTLNCHIQGYLNCTVKVEKQSNVANLRCTLPQVQDKSSVLNSIIADHWCRRTQYLWDEPKHQLHARPPRLIINIWHHHSHVPKYHVKPSQKNGGCYTAAKVGNLEWDLIKHIGLWWLGVHILLAKPLMQENST